MIKDAIDAYLISLKKHRESIPHDGEVLKGTMMAILRSAGITKEELRDML
jgi:hypothetical protein